MKCPEVVEQVIVPWDFENLGGPETEAVMMRMWKYCLCVVLYRCAKDIRSLYHENRLITFVRYHLPVC